MLAITDCRSQRCRDLIIKGAECRRKRGRSGGSLNFLHKEAQHAWIVSACSCVCKPSARRPFLCPRAALAADDDYYQRLAEGSDMSLDSTGSTPMSMSNGGNLVIISSMADSSLGSNNSVQRRPIDDLHFQTATHDTSVVSYIVVLLGVAPPHTLGEDMLAAALLDMRYPTEGLEGYDDWTINLQQLNMGQTFAQGAFEWLYRETYNGDEVAVKILKRPENNIGMDSAFAKEVMMLATVKHQNVVQFVGGDDSA
ncbi:hypothetical protein CY35_06G115300 [Sphagnum magellanicum]|nr:hypothetical protein CY35_06G115300 [Sphagnum magellanicum]